MSQTKVQLVNDVSGNSGFGLSSATGVVHLHESSSGSIEGLKITNSTTGSGLTDGLSIGLQSDEDVFIHNYENTSMLFGTNDATRFTITNDGKVGIGNTSPQQLLHVWPDTANTSSAYVRVTAGDRGSGTGLDLGHDSSGNCHVNAVSNAHLIFSSNNTERMRISNDGKVGIGTTSPSAKIHADNGGSGNVAFLKHASSGIAVTLTLQNNRATGSTEGEQISFLDDTGTQRGKITNGTSSTSYHTSSDYRLKENEVLISDGIERVKQLKPYKFNWKHIPNKTVDGFFAHEVENLVEDCVDGIKDKVVTQEDHNKGDYTDKEIGTEIHQMMDHSKLVPLLTAALKEEIAKREALETRVATLEAV